MTCAKVHVRAVVVTDDGRRFSGTNECFNPQAVCPRVPGEGYEKCKTICQQHAHAEVNALAAAGPAARGAVMEVDYYYACEACIEACKAAGIREIRTRDQATTR